MSHQPTATVFGGAAETDKGHARCPDCGHAASGPFCSECGQETHVHRSLGHLLHELLHGVMHFDGRMWRTLPLLWLNPGRLTREWIAGRRTRYVQPLALFLCTLFVIFMALSFGGGTSVEIGRPQGDPAAASFSLDLGGMEKSGVVQTIAKKLKNPELAAYKLQQTMYKFAFLLVPLSVPFMALLFLFRRGVTLYDHSVFVLYSLTFMAMLAGVMTLVDAIPFVGGWLVLAGLLAIPVHMFAQLKGAYGLDVFGALWRTFFLLIFCAIVLTLFILAIVYLGLGH